MPVRAVPAFGNCRPLSHNPQQAQPLLNLSGLNTLRLQSAGTAGEDRNKAMLNYILLVQTPVTVYSSSTVNGTYTLEGRASPN